jgi:hypothetical protein
MHYEEVAEIHSMPVETDRSLVARARSVARADSHERGGTAAGAGGPRAKQPDPGAIVALKTIICAEPHT